MFTVCLVKEGTYYGIFDDIKIMKSEYSKIKNKEFDDIEYIVDSCHYKKIKNREIPFKLCKEHFILTNPIKMNNDDYLLIFLERQSDSEIDCIHLVKNKYSYSECIMSITHDDFKKYCPNININDYSKNLESPCKSSKISKFIGLTPLLSVNLPKLLKKGKHQKSNSENNI